MIKSIFVGTGIVVNVIILFFFASMFALGLMNLPRLFMKIKDIGDLSATIHNTYYKELKNYNVRLYEKEGVIIIIDKEKDSEYFVNIVKKENKN